MIRVDGAYLYTVGSQIHPLDGLEWGTADRAPTTYEEARHVLYVAESVLKPLLRDSVFRLRISVQSGNTLLDAIKALKDKIDDSGDMKKCIEFSDTYPITSGLRAFETVLGAEFALSPLYLVTQKAGFDTAVLIDNGAACFPAEVWTKAPGAIPDLQHATRCIAFELFTASGFHLHRANETILGLYWDTVTNGDPRPNSRNMGEYLVGLDNKNVGDAKVKAALKELKDLHRNPLIHPEQTIDDADEAISLMNSVQSAMRHMLKKIPATAPSPMPPAGSAAPS